MFLLLTLTALKTCQTTSEEKRWTRLRRSITSLEEESEEEEEEKTRNTLKLIIAEYRPRPLTPQMLSKIDEGDAASRWFAADYKILLTALTRKLGSSWLLPHLRELFALDGGDAPLLYDSLLALTNALKSASAPSSRLDNILDISRHLLRSDFLTSALVYECCGGATTMRMSGDDAAATATSTARWADLVRLIVAYPSRVANKSRCDLPECFAPRNYVRVMYAHSLKAMQMVTEAMRHEAIHRLHVEPVAELLSKVVASFECAADEFGELVYVLEGWCADPAYRRVVSQVLASLEGAAVSRVAYAILRHIGNPRSTAMVLGEECGVRNPRWRYCLCDALFFKSYHEEDRVLINLVAYISATDMGRLQEVLEGLLNVWSDKSALYRTSFEQHLYISKAIVLCGGALSSWSEFRAAENAQRILFSGIPTHFESSEERIRAVGMIVAECMIAKLGAGNEVQFEYDELRSDSRLIVEQIRAMSKVDLQTVSSSVKLERAAKKEEEEDPLERYLNGIAELTPKERTLSERVIDSPPRKVEEKSVIVVDTATGDEEKEEPWDSDDELEPYDVSNDVKISDLKRPRYLRDLIEGLLEQKDRDIWVGSVETCETLVKQQLIRDDSCVGIEILSLLLKLEAQFYLENFDQLRYEAAVSVVNVYPEEGATYVSEQFHSAAGTYTISHKILMLEVLVGSARELSALKRAAPTETTRKSTKVEEQRCEWEATLRRRIEQNTRHKTSGKRELVTKANSFNSCVGYFFYPLIRGSGGGGGRRQRDIMVRLVGVDSYPLLAQYVNTLSMIMCYAVNCTLAPKMAIELLEFARCFREHPDFKIRAAVLRCVGSVAISVPKSLLTEETDLFGGLVEMHSWMENKLRSLEEPSGECAELMGQIMGLLRSTFNPA